MSWRIMSWRIMSWRIMSRRCSAVFTIVLVTFSVLISASVVNSLNVTAKNGEEFALRLKAVKGSPYVSLQELTRLLDKSRSGFRTEWDDTFGVLRITRGADNFSLFLDKTTLLVNTQILEVDEPVRVIGGEVLIPLSSLKALNHLWKEFIFEGGEAKPPERIKVKPSPTLTPTPAAPEATSPPLPKPSSEKLARVIIDPASKPLRWDGVRRAPVNLPPQDTLTLDIALRIKAILEREGSIEVVLTSRGNESPSLEKKIERINTSGASALVVLRLEASESDHLGGINIMVASAALDPVAQDYEHTGRSRPLPAALAYLPYQRQSLVLANTAFIELGKAVSSRLGPITPAPLYILRRAAMPSVLISCGYITNPTDASHLARERYRESIARAIAAALLNYKRSLGK